MTKAKILVHKDYESEYGTYLGNGDFATCSTPHLYPMTFTLEGLVEIVEKQEGIKLDTNGWYVTIVEINEVK